MAVNCAILSYNGMAYFGFSGDVHAAPDLRRLEELVKQTFTELCDAAGIRPPQKKRVRRRRQAVSVSSASAKSAPAKSRPAPVRTPFALLFERQRACRAESETSTGTVTTEPENAPTERIVA